MQHHAKAHRPSHVLGDWFGSARAWAAQHAAVSAMYGMVLHRERLGFGGSLCSVWPALAKVQSSSDAEHRTACKIL